jgi:hypothetical protein
MIRLSLPNVLIVAASVLTGGCEARSAVDNAVAPQQREEQRAEAASPFATKTYAQGETASPSAVASCVTMRLQEAEVVSGEMHGVIKVHNRCSRAIAVLTSPLEVRMRLRSDDHFFAEVMASAVYAIAYIYDDAAGLPRDAFRGDGGLNVFRTPKHHVVGAGSSGVIPMKGTADAFRQLASGTYGFALLTPVVFADSDDASRPPFEFAASVEKHNSGAAHGADPFRIPSASARLSAVGKVTVR